MKGGVAMSTKDMMYIILNLIDKSYKNNDFDVNKTFIHPKLEISEKELNHLLAQLINNGYIDCLSVVFGTNDNVVFNTSNPHLTIKGKLFLEDNSALKKIYNFAKEARSWI